MTKIILKCRRTGLRFMAERAEALSDHPYKVREFEDEARMVSGARKSKRGKA